MEKITTIYLIRHSEKLNNNFIDNNSEDYQDKIEKIILSVEGEKKAAELSKKPELIDVDVIFSSNYVRAIQTAKYLAESKKVVIHIDKRFNERKLGKLNTDEDFYFKQYYDMNLKNIDGESRREVQERMLNGFLEAVKNNKGKKIAIFTHGAAMTFLLMKWCKLEYINKEKRKCLSFNNKIIVDKIFNTPEVFRIKVIDNNKILSIENIELNMYGVKNEL